MVLGLASALGGGGCSGYLPSPVTPDTGKTAEGPRRDFLTITEIRWTRGDEPVVSVSREGVLREGGAAIGVVRADGTFATRNEKAALVMEPDGTIHVGPGFDMIIGEDGTAVSKVHGQPDETVTLEQVQKPRGGQPALVPSGLTGATRRTAMWVLMIPDLLRLRASNEGE
ncbi:MAG: hypothetical protein R3B70_05360 [Polyangiaceae bacterium]